MYEICSDLQESIAIAHAAGVQDQAIILDPGIGFGKTVEQNLASFITCRLRKLGYRSSWCFKKIFHGIYA